MVATAVKTSRRITKKLDEKLLADIIHDWTVSDFSLPDTSVINLIKNSPEHNRETFEAISECQTRIDEAIKSIHKLQKKYRVELTKTVAYGKEYDTILVNIGNLHFSIDNTNYFYRDCCISIAKFYDDYYQFNFNHLHFHNSCIEEGNEGICLGNGGRVVYQFVELGRFDLAIKTIVKMLTNINLDSLAINVYEAEKWEDYYLGRYVHSGTCPECGKIALAKTGIIDLSDTEEYHVVYHKKCWQKLGREDD